MKASETNVANICRNFGMENSKLAKQSHNTCQHAEHVSCRAETTSDSCGEYIKMYTNQKNSIACTAKNQYRKFETNIPRKGNARPRSQFPHSRVCERFIYSHDRSAYSAAGKIYGRILGVYTVTGSQTHESGNGDWGRAIPRQGIHKWDFRAVCFTTNKILDV
jgi:hypothetical protein